ncbi:sensor domain-containing phosphodiesterase [Marinimicrobium sp. ABcell2]|uniref:sensor domain-containing phosphodiesterase n=1 Tax=Marinimicrobium sp. ABcell2 TaxID=3069751 RepID=UPI0027B82591|nr:sensor domain-containing phosphodiesterase [Marinimicrobium sp. ABcell2]MDQ2078447.1 sensor domain-containing phosphodiesterase [Marinimicrobium sp. ABcell2]
MSAESATYVKPEIPADEEERLEELRGLNLLGVAADERFDRYTALVANLFEFPVVLITLIDANRQWFKSACGWSFRETTRDVSFCAHAINEPEVMVIPDACKDERFAGNPLVTGPPYIRFYAGAQVHGPSGKTLGTLCLIDHKPRTFDDCQIWRLRQFANLVESEIRHKNDLQQVRASVEFSAYYDPLTRLPNRRLLTDRLTQLLALSQASERQLAVLLMNVAGLRLVNQSLGTEAGDELLAQVADRLRDVCPGGGTVARLQADEFVMVVPNLAEDANDIDQVADRVRGELEKPFLYEGGEQYLRILIGGSIFPEHGVSPQVLIEKASAAIRFSGREDLGIRYFTHAESVSISERLKIESSMRGALEKNQFCLHYQPIVSLHTGELAGVEALLRWHSSELGVMHPEEFIPIAEQAGLIVPVGRWVQAEVFRQIRAWCAQGEWNIPVALNVAPVELLKADFAQVLLDQLNSAGIPHDLLWVEVTESLLLSDDPQVDSNLALLHEAGLRVSIDDFGTGYSNLSHLRRLPISTLKIDRSFMSGVPGQPHEMALAEAIINIAKTLDLNMVAEGLETREQLDFLKRAECQYAQGFLISKALAPDKIPSLRGRPLL